MKAVPLGKATRTVGKVFFGFALLLLAVGAGFGGTALIVYHQLGGTRPAEAPRVVERVRPERKEAPRLAPVVSEEISQPRRVAATSTDVPSYSYADNNGGQPSLPAKRQKPVVNVPAALETTTSESSASGNLNDPESHYIVDSRTGRVIGIDGTVGAKREAEEEQRLLEAAPRAVAVQTPPPEVRVASAVMEEGQPVYHGAQSEDSSLPGSQYVPVRRAVPVAVGDTLNESRGFNVAEYLANDRNRPSLRTQSSYATGARTARTTHVFRLPDGTQALVTD